MILSRPFIVGAPALALIACGADPVLPPDGAHYQYVVSELRTPTTNTEARMNGLDLDGNKTVDNLMGQIFSTLNSQGLGVGETADEALLRGGLIMLADLQTTNFDDAPSAGVTMYLGGTPVPDACTDPTRLDTCGQHLLGSGLFTVDEASASRLAVAPIKNAVFVGSMSRLPVEIALDPTAPIRLVLHGAKVRWSAISPDHASAILAGGITRADVDGVVIPEAAAQLDRIVVEGCHPVEEVGVCECSEGARGISLLSFFDDNDDCHISSKELAASELIQGLLDADIRVDGEDLVSFGVSVELVAASFTSP